MRIEEVTVAELVDAVRSHAASGFVGTAIVRSFAAAVVRLVASS